MLDFFYVVISIHENNFNAFDVYRNWKSSKDQNMTVLRTFIVEIVEERSMTFILLEGWREISFKSRFFWGHCPTTSHITCKWFDWFNLFDKNVEKFNSSAFIFFYFFCWPFSFFLIIYKFFCLVIRSLKWRFESCTFHLPSKNGKNEKIAHTQWIWR